jgi:hypothetical protein
MANSPRTRGKTRDESPDELAIIATTVRYSTAIDERRFELLDEVFIPDARFDYGPEDKWDSTAVVIDIMRGAHLPLDGSQHRVFNHVVNLDGDRATCRCYCEAVLVLRGLPGGDVVRNHVVYLDDLVRTTDGWRIARRRVEYLLTEGNLAILDLMIKRAGTR